MRNRVDGRWDVAVVALLAGTFAIATNRSIGWFYVAYMDEFNVDRQTASWPGSVLLAVFRGAGILVSVLHRRMSLYRISLISSCLLWGGIGASVFAPSIAWITFTVGFLHGVGCGLLLISHMVLIMQYFKKYRGLATGVRLTANPLSGLVFPPVLSALGDSYGFRGAMLIYTGIIMHVTALALFLKEPPWLAPRRTKEDEMDPSKSDSEIESRDDTGCDSSALSKADEPAGAAFSIHVVIEESRKRSSSILEAEALLQSSPDELGDAKSKRTAADVPTSRDEMHIEASDSKNCSAREKVSSSRNENSCDCWSSREKAALEQLLPVIQKEDKSLDMRSIRNGKCNVKKDPLLPASDKLQEIAGRNGSITFGSDGTQPRVSRAKLPALTSRWIQRQLRRALPARTPLPRFLTGVLGSMLLDYVNSVHLFTMVDYARDKDVPRSHAAMALTYAAGPEIVGRVFLPFVADLGWVSRPAMTCGNLFALGLLLAVTPQTGGAMHVVLRALTSLSIAALLTMKHVLIADYLGSEAVSLVSGSSGLLLLPVIFCNPLIFGYFRDTMGSYDNLYRISGGILLCAAFAVFGRLLYIGNTRTKVTDTIVDEK
ncbi:uncharacterized protein LOC144125562 isoform X2 [Amblyomma americanum]